MKTNLFIAASLLLSSATYAQTVGSSSAQSAKGTTTLATQPADLTTSANNSTTVTTQADGKIAAHGSEAKQKASKEVNYTKTAVKKDEKQVKNNAVTVAGETSSSVAVNNQGQANVSAQDNKVKGDASLHSSASISAKPVANTAKSAAVQSSKAVKNEVKTTANTASATSAGLKTSAQQKIQPKPVAIKTQAHVMANGGIKIK